MTTIATVHWDGVYGAAAPEEMSWFEAEPRSFELIDAAAPSRDAAIIDVGGGTSALAARLIEAGYHDVTVSDVSGAALAEHRRRSGDAGERITYIEGDLRETGFGRRFDLWHDRAVLHFMVEAADRDAYVERLKRSLAPTGEAIIATFGPEGPTSCSGLPTARYSGDELAHVFSPEFLLRSAELHTHRTPAGDEQQFLYAHLRRLPSAPLG
jgi:ubiquinone/menaquinone biosynthesis C-methylase UbiE